MSKNLKIVILILIVILLGSYILYYSLQSKSPPIDTGLTDAQKENAAQMMNQQLKNIPPLTDKQKEDIANKMNQSLSQ